MDILKASGLNHGRQPWLVEPWLDMDMEHADGASNPLRQTSYCTQYAVVINHLLNIHAGKKGIVI